MRTVEFHPVALKIIRGFSYSVRRSIGQAVLELQKGEKLFMPLSCPVKSIGSGVAEIRVRIQAVFTEFFTY